MPRISAYLLVAIPLRRREHLKTAHGCTTPPFRVLSEELRGGGYTCKSLVSCRAHTGFFVHLGGFVTAFVARNRRSSYTAPEFLGYASWLIPHVVPVILMPSFCPHQVGVPLPY